MRLTKIYVGSNNTTGELELDKIYSVLDKSKSIPLKDRLAIAKAIKYND